MAVVLVVDDEPDLRELLRVSLSMAGHQVLVAADGQQGLEVVRDVRPELVLLDVMMPVLDGWSVLEAIKADVDPAVAGIPVIMLTARGDDLDIVRGGIGGAVRYLTKPFALEDLRQAVLGAVTGGPEGGQRQAAQKAALTQLARLERGFSGAAPSSPAPRPRLSRLEPVSGGQLPAGPSGPEPDWPAWFKPEKLNGREHEILHVLVTSLTMTQARQQLGVSRSYLYARLRQISAKLGFHSGPALVQALRAAKASRDRQQGPDRRLEPGGAPGRAEL